MTTLLASRCVLYLRRTGVRRSAAVTQVEHVVLGILLAIAATMFLMQGFCVSGECMQPHLFTGERVLANKLVYHLAHPIAATS